MAGARERRRGARSARLIKNPPAFARGAERQKAPWAHRPPGLALPGTRLRGARSARRWHPRLLALHRGVFVRRPEPSH
jgi:hypothetical protein